MIENSLTVFSDVAQIKHIDKNEYMYWNPHSLSCGNKRNLKSFVCLEGSTNADKTKELANVSNAENVLGVLLLKMFWQYRYDVHVQKQLNLWLNVNKSSNSSIKLTYMI